MSRTSDKKNSEVFLVSSFADPSEVKCWSESKFTECNWVYLSDDYLKLIEWKEVLDNSFKYIPLSKGLDLATRNQKEPFLKWIAQLGNGYPEEPWWASRVSERNPMVSSLFMDICRLNVLREYLGVPRPLTMIVVESSSLMHILNQVDWINLARISVPHHLRDPFKKYNNFVKNCLLYCGLFDVALYLVRIAVFLYQAVQAKFAGKTCLDNLRNKNTILIHTYLDESSFSSDYVFSDRYFPGLERFYRENDYEVLVLPVMFGITRSFYSAWRWIKFANSKFLNPFSLYQFSDYIYSFKVALRAKKIPTEPLFFDGNDVQNLVYSEKRQFAFDVLPEILYLRLPLRLMDRGIKCRALVAEFENMIPEKMLNLGFKKYQPACERIGYQHSALFPNLLCNFIPKEEQRTAPIYDRIICNGTFFKDILSDKWMQPEILSVGPALRYKHLDNYLENPVNSLVNRPKNILIPLPLHFSGAVEMLHKAIDAFANEADITVILKSHPMSSVEVLLEAIGRLKLPLNFSISCLPIGDILRISSVVVGLGTTSLIEAASAGVPIVRVYRDSSLNLDPLGYFIDLPDPVFSADEIFFETNRILNLSDNDLNSLSEMYRCRLANVFHRFHEKGLRVFLPSI